MWHREWCRIVIGCGRWRHTVSQWGQHGESRPQHACQLYTQQRQYAQVYLPSVLWHCWLGDRKDIWPVKNWIFVCRWWWFDWSFARLIAPAVTTTSITLSSNKVQNGDILVPANPGPPGKWPLKRRELYWLKVQNSGRSIFRHRKF